MMREHFPSLAAGDANIGAGRRNSAHNSAENSSARRGRVVIGNESPRDSIETNLTAMDPKMIAEAMRPSEGRYSLAECCLQSETLDQSTTGSPTFRPLADR